MRHGLRKGGQGGCDGERVICERPKANRRMDTRKRVLTGKYKRICYVVTKLTDLAA